MENRKQKTDNPLLKEYFFTALIRLMDQKDFKDITISEIAKKAGVSRMTYYRTYSSKQDILIQYFDDHSKELLAKLESTPQLTAEQFALMFFSSFKEHVHYLKYLYLAGLMTEMLERFTGFLRCLYQRIELPVMSGSELEYHIRFVAGGLYMLLFHWQENGLKESPEEMAKMTAGLLAVKGAADRSE